MNTGINQIGGDSTVYIDGGQYIRLQSPDPRYGESLYYIDPQGVRYGLPNEDTGGTLGLSAPKTAPWQVVGLLGLGVDPVDEVVAGLRDRRGVLVGLPGGDGQDQHGQ